MFFWIGVDQCNGFVVEVVGCLYWVEFGIDEVGVMVWVWCFVDVDQFGQFVIFGVDDGNFVGGIGCVYEVVMC